MGLFKSIFEKVKAGLTKTSKALSLRTILSGKQLSPELLDQVERRLIQADVGIKTAVELRKDLQAAWERSEVLTGDDALKYLKDQLNAYWPPENRKLNFAPAQNGAKTPTVILVAGINGSGKTTSIAKIAKSLRDEGRTVLLAACDTFRAAAVEQLEIWARRAGVDMVRAREGADPAAVVYDAISSARSKGRDPVLVDTAGRLHTRVNLMNELEKIRRVASREVPGAPQEVLLVLDATVGQNGLAQAREFMKVAGVNGIVLTKLDGTAKGGVAVAIAHDLKLPIRYVGVGEGIDDLVPFSADEYVDGLFEEKW